MTARDADLVVCCNGAESPGWATDPHKLEYRASSADQNIHVGLPKFVESVNHIPDRILDLLELAAYIFAADRLAQRGHRDQVEYHSWARSWYFRMRVRDQAFWSQSEIREVLSEALRFMTGDADYKFEFLGGHATPPTSLFDMEGIPVEPHDRPIRVSLFSGGLDSLAGALQVVQKSDDHLLLVSHESQPGTMHTQRQLVQAIEGKYPGRISHYRFQCQLKGMRAAEETQRTRSLLYCTIGFAIAQAHRCSSLEVYENGVTSINLHRREDLMNARASRTTHPKTMKLMGRLFSAISEGDFRINLPFLWQTKQDVISGLASIGHTDLIASSVSCSRTFQRASNATHCGRCFQCVDRRIAIHGASLHGADDCGLYSIDIFREAIKDPEARTTAIDYVRQAMRISESNIDRFGAEYLVELGDVAESIDSTKDELEKIEVIWTLMKRHAKHVLAGLMCARNLHDNLFSQRRRGSLLDLISEREHFKNEVQRCVETIRNMLMEPLMEMLANNRPAAERQLNQLVGGLLRSHQSEIKSEHPTVRFAAARVVPDHEIPGSDLLIEAKYIRSKTTPSKASEGMAADITKYPKNAQILFLVYDPDHAVVAEREFREDFEACGRCTVVFIR